jgi:signal recognition particle GTPase
MATKKKKPTQSNRNWGGKREGGGRKPKEKPDYDAEIKDSIKQFANELTEEQGEHWLKAVMRMLYDRDVHPNARASIFNKLLDIHTVKKSEKQVEEIRKYAPGVLLPKKDKDPALEVLKGGKSGD